MHQHLEHLFGGFLDGCHDGLIEIAYTDAEDKKLRHARLFGTDEIEDAAQFAHEQNLIEGQNVYVGAALRKPDIAKDKRANDSDILCLTAFYTDLDEGAAAAQAKQRYRGCPPTCVVVTGRTPHTRAQLWWRQDTPECDMTQARAQNSALAAAFGGDRTVVNASRVMRLAGSIAWPHKAGRVKERTELQLFDNSRPKSYPLGQLQKAFPSAEEKSPDAPPAKISSATLNIGSPDPLSIEATLHAVRSGHQWHNNILRLVAHWIARGWSDAEILTAAESLTLPSFTAEQTRREVGQMILGARAKWAIPNPLNKVEEFASNPFLAVFLAELNIGMLPRRRWILGRSLLHAQLALMVAPPGVGKSTLVITQGIAICTGKNLTGQDVHEAGNVWIHNNEDDLDELKRRVAAVLQHYGVPFSDIKEKLALTSGADRQFIVAKTDRNGSVIRQPDVAACVEQIRKYNIKVFIVDPFAETHEVEENSNEQIKIVAQLYREIARLGDCAVLLVHHTAKPPQGSSEGHAGNMNTARGASALTGVARIVQTLFGMSARDGEKFAIQDEDRHLYVRLDDAKANLSLASPNALWFKRIGVTIANGDEVGVLEIADFSNKVEEIRDAEYNFQKTIISCLLAQVPEHTITLNAATKLLAWGNDERFHKYRSKDARGYERSSRTLREIVVAACRANISINNGKAMQGYTLDLSEQPLTLKRFSHPIDPLSQPEFTEDYDD